MDEQLIIIDKIKWWVHKGSNGSRNVVALCPQHHIRLKAKPDMFRDSRGAFKTKVSSSATKLECAEGPHVFEIPREISEEQRYVIDRIDAAAFKVMPVLNMDDEAIPVAREQLKDSGYWILSKVTKSKAGTRLIIWAGDRSKKNKTQLFIEPAIKKLSFDQNDTHPQDVFAKVEVIFDDGDKSSMTKG